jgi:hypothetical protein
MGQLLSVNSCFFLNRVKISFRWAKMDKEKMELEKSRMAGVEKKQAELLTIGITR